MNNITIEYLKQLFDEYNKLYFNNSLTRCKFHLHKDDYSYATYIYKKNGISHIWLTTDTYWTESLLKEVLIHEMIHHYIRTVENKTGGIFGHNWRFRKQCRRIEKNYGIKIHITIGGHKHCDYWFNK